MSEAPAIPITGDDAADRLLVENQLALLIGMLLDQQVPMEWAFRGPSTLQERLGGSLDAETIAAMGPDKIEAIFRDKPAMHRYPGSMGKRTYALCAYIVEPMTSGAPSWPLVVPVDIDQATLSPLTFAAVISLRLL